MNRAAGHIVWGALSPIESSNSDSSNTKSSEGKKTNKPKAYGNVLFKTNSPSTSSSVQDHRSCSAEHIPSDLATAQENLGVKKKKQIRPSKKTRMLSKRVVEMLDLIQDPAEKQACMEQLSADDPYMRLLCGGKVNNNPENAAAAAGGGPPSSSAATASSSKPKAAPEMIIGI